MTTASTQDGIRAIPLDQIRVSTTGSQAERRAHFDKAAIAELAESIKAVGLLSPIIARPVNGHFELVAGERRFLAAQKAGLSALNVSIRELTDEQVLEIQLIENLQREGLHELAEAEGYEALRQMGHTAEEIADKVGKSKAYVYGRLKLTALGPAAREAFYRGELTASIALLLARMADPASQREAVGKITKPGWDQQPMSFRQAREFIEREYMFRLNEAPFPTGDADLLPKAGACGPCPKRTGNQAELFADIKSGDVCSDPSCFKLKREAWAKVQIAEAKTAGRKVITGAEANAIAKHGYVSNGYAKLDEFCFEDAKNRTYKQLLGKKSDIVQLLQMPKTGEIIEVVQKSEAVKAARKAGTLEARTNGSSPYGTAVAKPKDKAKAAEQAATIDQLLIAIHKHAPKSLERPTLLTVADYLINAAGQIPQGFFTAWGWDADSFDKVPKLTNTELNQLIFELALIEQLPYANEDLAVKQLTAAAKGLRVDLKKVKADVAASLAPKTESPTSIPKSPKKRTTTPRKKK